MPREPLSQARRLVIRRDSSDAFDADRLHEDVRRFEDERADGAPRHAGANERDRRAVAVPEKDDFLEFEMLEDGGEHFERFVVHEANGPYPTHRVGPVSYTHLRAHETRHDLVCRL